MSSFQQSGLEIVCRFRYPHEAELARLALEAEGISAWVFDATKGGAKVAVAPADAPRARTALAEDRSHLLADIPEQSLPAHPDEHCPMCGSEEVQAASRPWLGIFGRRRAWCDVCAHRWTPR